MTPNGQNSFEAFFSVIRDKRLRPWFWIFTLFYFLAGAFGLYKLGWLDPELKGAKLIGFALLFPYMIISTVYISYALSKKPRGKK
jgi:hypothetical protein